MSDNTIIEVSSQYGNAKISNFDWVTDKNLLRDEGIYHGLADSERTPTEKVEAIRQFFQEQIKALEVDRISKHKLFREIALTVEEIQAGIQQHKLTIQGIKGIYVNQEHNFWRYLIGYLAYVLILVSNFGLI